MVIVGPATSAEPLPTIPKALESELVSFAEQAKRAGDAMVHIVGTAGGLGIERDLTPLRGKDVEHGSARERKIRENIAALGNDLANLRTSAPGLDVLGPLDAASQYPGARIVALSSGLSTTAPVDLTLGWNFNPAAVAESVQRQGLLHLAGHDVTFAGIGVVGGSVQTRLPAALRKQVQDLWIAICQKAGATSCRLMDSEPSTEPPRSTLPVPVVPVPTAHTDSDGCAVWQRLSDEQLHFAANSSEVPSSADSVLQPLVDSVKRCTAHRVEVVGHIAATTPGGRDESNLSGRRAEAVAARLVALGLPSNLLGTVAGRGASEPVIPNYSPSGQFLEAAAAQNRRVEVELHR
ncbi:OmpA family protein [Nocardia mexicana]|uniref:OmpA family protein n=1 Tax=Nocardia mexicana TaxID=279262 RepID=UPI0014723868|nr:OmpA family protein [Nocardia mexicana]